MSDRLERKERVRARKTVLKLAVVVTVIIFAGSLVYLTGRNLIAAYRDHQRDTVLAQYGAIEENLQGQGLVLRHETVFNAPATGFFENMVSDGGKVRINALLGYYITRGEKQSLHASASGLFTRQIDGLEGVLQNVTVSAVGPETFSYRIQHHDPEAEFKTGQGVYKIVDNLEPTRLILQFPEQKATPELKKDQPASLYVDGKMLGECTVLDFKNDFHKLVVMVETSDFKEELLNKRQVNAELTMRSPSGYLIPEKSVINRGQEKGIYCVDGEEIIFRAVQVLAIKDGTAVVEGLKPNDMVIIKPDKVKL
jgi:putative membrane fusion protein